LLRPARVAVPRGARTGGARLLVRLVGPGGRLARQPVARPHAALLPGDVLLLDDGGLARALLPAALRLRSAADLVALRLRRSHPGDRPGRPLRAAGETLRRALADPLGNRIDGRGSRDPPPVTVLDPAGESLLPRRRPGDAQPVEPRPALPAHRRERAGEHHRPLPQLRRPGPRPRAGRRHLPLRGGRCPVAVLGGRRADGGGPLHRPGRAAAGHGHLTDVLTRDFDFELPAASIAQEAAPRGESRLLVLDREGADRHAQVADLPRLLLPGDLLVLNDTRVIPARLFGRRAGWPGKMELLLDENLVAEVILKREDGRHLLRFSEPVEPHLERLGHVPLPPYIHRPDTPEDRERYQTVYARSPGAVAAPTAGLHFTESLLEEIAAAGIEIARVTLHVGIGTFKPVTAERIEDHRMERERYEIGAEATEAIRRARDRDGRI